MTTPLEKRFSHSRIPIGILIVGFGVFVLKASAQDTSSPIPKAVEPGHFTALMEHSPFTRVVLLSDSLILTGTAQMDGKPIATLMDTEAAESILVSEQPTERGWRLVDLSGAEDIETSMAVISVEGGQVIKIRYDKERMKAASQRMKFAARARSQQVTARTSAGSGKGGASNVPAERIAMLKKIDQRELPKGYNPGAGKNREESHNLHQSYVDRRMGEMSDRQKGMVGQMWQQKMAVDPNMSNRGASFVRIMEHVAENEKR